VENDYILEVMQNELGLVIYDTIPAIACSFEQITHLQGDSCKFEDELYFYHGDHLSSTQMITDANGAVQQQVLYAPFGEVISEYNAYWHQGKVPDYMFNAKEMDEGSGMYYYSARYYAPPVFISRDPLFEKYPFMSPYAYCANNPVIMIDPSGREVEISGEAKKSAFRELKKGARQHNISLRMNRDGIVSGKYKGKGEISQDGQQLLNAINDKQIKVNVVATNGTETSIKGRHMTGGGAFMGSEINSDGTVSARQEVNPKALNLKSWVFRKPGQDMLHEVTEGYQGGLLAKEHGISIPPAFDEIVDVGGSYYDQAHNSAIPPSGTIQEIIIIKPETYPIKPIRKEYWAKSGKRSALISSHPIP
jgi:RHS repeat-associated protein